MNFNFPASTLNPSWLYLLFKKDFHLQNIVFLVFSILISQIHSFFLFLNPKLILCVYLITIFKEDRSYIKIHQNTSKPYIFLTTTTLVDQNWKLKCHVM